MCHARAISVMDTPYFSASSATRAIICMSLSFARSYFAFITASVSERLLPLFQTLRDRFTVEQVIVILHCREGSQSVAFCDNLHVVIGVS